MPLLVYFAQTTYLFRIHLPIQVGCVTRFGRSRNFRCTLLVRLPLRLSRRRQLGGRRRFGRVLRHVVARVPLVPLRLPGCQLFVKPRHTLLLFVPLQLIGHAIAGLHENNNNAVR